MTVRRLLLAAFVAAAFAVPVQASAEACAQHDSYSPTPLPAEVWVDDDSDLAAWIAAGPDPSAGSEKVTTACVSLP